VLFRSKAQLRVGNVFMAGARPSVHEANPLMLPDADPKLRLVGRAGRLLLEGGVNWAAIRSGSRPLVTGAMLGRATTPGLPYENPDGSPVTMDRDYFRKARDPSNPTPGPFEGIARGPLTLRVR
jgi:alpha-L-arabinofuranosidase